MENSKEIWAGVPGYENSYMISTFGRVKSLPKVVVDPNGRVRHYNELIMKQQVVNKYGHLKVSFRKNNERKEFLVHRLVLMSFDRMPVDNEEALHKDGNPKNNFIENLKWGTSKENSQDSLLHGTIARGKDLPQTKLSEDDVIKIRSDRRTSTEIANEFNISPRHVRAIKSKIYWKYI